MVLYELLSNVASTDQGLREQPACLDLAQTFSAFGVNLRFLRQAHRETDEINLASAQFGKGVRVRGTALKSIRPETHIKGCMAWSRAILGRIDRGLHLEVSHVRAGNAAGLVMGQIRPRGHRVFLSGLEPGQWPRLEAAPDPLLKTVPAPIRSDEALFLDYMRRRDRTAGFFTQLADVAGLEFLPGAHRERLAAIAREREEKALGALTEAEVVNIGLLAEYLERYRGVVEQYAGLFGQGELTAELAAHFDLLTHGIPYVETRITLESHTPEATRGRIRDKRSLVNELRIALSQAPEAERVAFARRLRGLVVKHRIRLDPPLYTDALRLAGNSAEWAEALGPYREQAAAFRRGFLSVRGRITDAAQPVPPPMKEPLFELLLRLTFDGQFASRLPAERLPAAALVARWLLADLRLDRYDLAQLRRVSPKLPPKGVAVNLAEKVPVTWSEIDRLVEALATRLFPHGAEAEAIGKEIAEKLEAETEQRRAEAVRQYLEHSHVLLGLTNYVLGRAQLPTEAWAGLLAAGQTLGLPMLASRDQIRSDKALRQVHEGLREQPEGYVLLLNQEHRTLFPLEAEPEMLARAFRHLLESQVVRTVRRFLFQKLQVLVKTHGNRFFEVLYRHVRGRTPPLSRHQFAHVLLRHRVFEKTRLRELGYSPEHLEGEGEGENPWLLPEDAPPALGPNHPFAHERIAKTHAAALAAFYEHLAGLPEPPAEAPPAGEADAGQPGPRLPLTQALALLARDETHDPQRPEAAAVLTRTDAAAALWRAVQQAVSQNFKAIMAGVRSTAEAIPLALPGELAPLAHLRPQHAFKAGQHSLLFRLEPEPLGSAEELDAAGAAVAAALTAAVRQDTALGRARALLARHIAHWETLREASALALIDQMLRETVLRYVEPAPPLPADVRARPDESVLCLGVSSSDQAKFHKLLERVDRADVFATLSELASWLARFPRLEEELAGYRGLIDDIVAVVDTMHVTVWDAPYLPRYRNDLRALRAALDLRPEHFTRPHLERLEELAREMSQAVRDIHAREQTVRPRDRWLNRIATRLRAMRPQSGLTFVDRLWEGAERDGPPETPTPEAAEAAETAGKAALGRDEKEFQTFSERVRNVIEYRERLDTKDIFVLSPANTQRTLTLGLVDRLFALKGLDTAILVDVSGCESFVPALRTRLPPHRLFDLNRL